MKINSCLKNICYKLQCPVHNLKNVIIAICILQYAVVYFNLYPTGHKWKPSTKVLSEPEQNKLPLSLVDPSWEMLDPNPNIFDLFLTFNHQFFWERLLGVEVKWSPRMTL